MTRILVYGVCGSGKTTLAARIHEATGLPWHSVDDLTWEPGWIEVPAEEQRKRFEAICAEPEWILDTAYAKWLDVPMARVQMIVALDYPRWLSFGRLLRRTCMRLVDGKKICNGNRETLRNFFSRESILIWHCRSFDGRRRRIAEWAAASTGPKIVRLKHPRETESWLQDLAERRQRGAL